MAEPLKYEKEHPRGTKEHLLWQLNGFFLIDFLFFIFMVISLKVDYLKWAEHLDLIVYSSIGLLTFVAIFYSLAYSASTKEKLNKLTDQIDEYFKEVNLSFQKKKESTNDLKELTKEIKQFKRESRDVRLFKKLIKIDVILYATGLFFIFSIIFCISQHILVASLSFILGTTLTVHIITTWVFIFQREDKIEGVRKEISASAYIIKHSPKSIYQVMKQNKN